MTITDEIIIILSLFLIIRGALRGFIKSLLGPFSVITASALSIIYYQKTQAMIISLLIGLIGPLILHLALKAVLNIWAIGKDKRVYLSPLSRLAGSILTLFWGGLFITFSLILIAVVPPVGNALSTVHDDVTQSKSYALVKPLKDIFFATAQASAPAAPSTATLDAKTLAQDPRFQKVLQDPQIQQDIQAHDFVKLMSNPKMLDLTKQIMNDPATLKKIMGIYANNQVKPQEGSNTTSGN